MEYTEQMKHRVKRLEGQKRGVLRMMDEEQDCKKLVFQMNAARTVLDRDLGLIVGSNLEQCVREQTENGENDETFIQEAVNPLVKSR
ncbi:metal-sensitive transcriptional regulator [Marinococcus sp. PL1-022]|uniref:metal-sensitive transcriptional regulator n=1 Tax=Marinococcus sp. PL1-022 TaxID=3095363 RepID=UPI0029C3DFD2|nr:metal-sensitive transcriptional regulator [Marinococcus sp. PL1-022]MDX6153127.1 metal-sensitive transcriptional regulator [Marinococcus sp. PL1-022]